MSEDAPIIDPGFQTMDIVIHLLSAAASEIHEPSLNDEKQLILDQAIVCQIVVTHAKKLWALLDRTLHTQEQSTAEVQNHLRLTQESFRDAVLSVLSEKIVLLAKYLGTITQLSVEREGSICQKMEIHAEEVCDALRSISSAQKKLDPVTSESMTQAGETEPPFLERARLALEEMRRNAVTAEERDRFHDAYESCRLTQEFVERSKTQNRATHEIISAARKVQQIVEILSDELSSPLNPPAPPQS